MINTNFNTVDIFKCERSPKLIRIKPNLAGSSPIATNQFSQVDSFCKNDFSKEAVRSQINSKSKFYTGQEFSESLFIEKVDRFFHTAVLMCKMVFYYQNCSDLLWEKLSSDREKLLKFEAKAQEFANFWGH